MRALALAGLITSACGPLEETVSIEEHGFLLLDAEAGAAGLAIEHDGVEARGPLPRAYPAGAEVRLVGPGGGERIEVVAGSLGQVLGSRGRLQWSVLGEGVRENALIVDASSDAAERLADELGAEIVAAQDGRFILSAPDLLPIACAAAEVDGVVEIAPVLVTDPVAGAGADELSAAERAVLDRDTPARAAPVGDDSTLVVGLYRSARGRLLLDAEGGFVRWDLRDRCGSNTARGRYTVRGGQVLLDDDEVLTVYDESLIDAAGRALAPEGRP